MRPHSTSRSFAAIILLAACSSGSHPHAIASAGTSGTRAETVLAIGSSATEGDGVPDRLQGAWPYLVFRESLPESTVFVNGALDDATIAHAITSQAPLAKELKPDIVEIWLGVDDLRFGTPIAAFTLDYIHLIDTLRADGSRRILVADLPAVYGPKASAYDAAIHAVVARTHAELVPLARADITLAPTDGLPPQPNAASHRIIAAAFAHQIARGS